MTSLGLRVCTTLHRVSPSRVSPMAERENYEKVKAFLGHRMRVTVSDGRVIMGKFKCFDNNGGVFLFQAESYKPFEEALRESMAEKNQRALRDVFIPGKHIVKCEVDELPYPY